MWRFWRRKTAMRKIPQVKWLKSVNKETSILIIIIIRTIKEIFPLSIYEYIHLWKMLSSEYPLLKQYYINNASISNKIVLVPPMLYTGISSSPSSVTLTRYNPRRSSLDYNDADYTPSIKVRIELILSVFLVKVDSRMCHFVIPDFVVNTR